MRDSSSTSPKVLSALVIAVAFHLALPSRGSAQGLQDLVTDCGGDSELLTLLCHRAALALDGARGGVATAASGGSPVPGSASTMGYRIRGFPRFALSARAGLTRSSVADLSGEPSVVRTNEGFTPSLHLSGTLGLLDGFSLRPAVGGVLSLDVLASSQVLFASKDQGFREGLLGWGVGARIGILRESFTLPGVSVSVTRNWMGSVAVGNLESGGMSETEFDTNVTSLRGVVGKDFLGFGLLAGAGWDRVSGKGLIRARVLPDGPEGSASSSDLSSRRAVFFGGASMTFLILQVSAEAGWSKGLDRGLPTRPQGDEFPSSSVYFASLGIRVTF
ncbi:MAG: hypothetical protein ACWGSQ_12990 [Longimicrobiales bacterium]